MKIVINRKYGGFSLSHDAIMRYAEIKGFKLNAYIKDSKLSDFDDDCKYIPYDGRDMARMGIIHYTSGGLDEKGQLKEDGYFWERDIERNDPALIQVVEELGEAANGSFSALKIVDIPDNVQWEISEYDGMETVEEKHRSWY